MKKIIIACAFVFVFTLFCQTSVAYTLSDTAPIDFETYPYFGGAHESVEKFEKIMHRALTQSSRAVRFLYDGDSQETSPGGQGFQYIPLVAYNFWKEFGNIPESQLMAIASYAGASGAVLQAGSVANGVAFGDTALSRYPFYVSPGGDGSVKSRFTYNASEGVSTVFQANMNGVSPALTEIKHTVSYMDRAGLKFNVLIPYLSTQGNTLRMRSSISSTGNPGFYNGNQDIQTRSITDTILNANAWKVVTVDYQYGSSTPIPQNLSTLYPQMIVSGHSDFPNTPVEIGPTWFSASSTKGIAISTISKGGAVTTAQFADGLESLPLILAYDPDVVILSTSVNDAVQGIGVTADQYKINMQEKINTYLYANPNLVFVLMSDPDVTNAAMSPEKLAEFDAMPSKLRELALIPENRAVFINRNAILKEKYNWTRVNDADAQYLVDDFHYSLKGARVAAREDVKAMLILGGIKEFVY